MTFEDKFAEQLIAPAARSRNGWLCVGAFVVGLVFCSLLGDRAGASDWPSWRGPDQDGGTRDVPLLSEWSTKGENLIWRNEAYATRSTPIVMNGKLYTVCRAFPETTQEGEKVVCVDAKTGELIWESVHNVFLSDAPAERVGWSSVVGDPASKRIYMLGIGCLFQCLDADTGKVLWERSLSEEYGMLSTYGGRTNFPVVFEDLVIISGVTTGWGETAVPAHRVLAFDKMTGDAVWLTSTRLRPEDTTYSTPTITSFNGQMAMVFGAGDGAVYALQPRTGKVIWKYQASNRGISTPPLVHDNIVYCGHSEQNASDTTVLGALFAFDGRKTGDIAESDLLWKIPARTVGRSQPIVVGDRLYAVEDGGTLWVIDAKTGKEIGRQKLGRIMFGSLVHGDGKIYAGEATGRWYALEPAEKGVKVLSQVRLNGEEILGSPIFADGRMYLPTGFAMYCLGDKDAQVTSGPAPAAPAETPVAQDRKVAQIQVIPVEVMATPGKAQKFTVRAFNANGQVVDTPAVKFTVQGKGTVDSSGVFTPAASSQPEIVMVTAEVGELKSTSRVRVLPPLPWKFDFADKKVPLNWIGMAYRHQPKQLDGEDLLVKVSTIPKGTRSQGWMGPTDLHDYTIQADFLATERDEKLPDMGLINQRYTLAMHGDFKLQIRSWTSRLELRFAKTVPFTWEPGKWYTMKFQSENKDGQAVLRGKVWPRGETEPEAWMIEAADATPNTVGSPGLFGNATDAEFYIDNVLVTPNH